MLQPQEWVAEEVIEFPWKSIIVRYLGDIYAVDACVLDPPLLGHPNCRERLYNTGSHMAKRMSPTMTLQAFVDSFLVLIFGATSFRVFH